MGGKALGFEVVYPEFEKGLREISFVVKVPMSLKTVGQQSSHCLHTPSHCINMGRDIVMARSQEKKGTSI